MKKISVVIAACNAGPMLRDTINSLKTVLERANCLWEIIVVDDASEDGSTDGPFRIDSRHFALIKLYRRAGHSGAKRVACSAATGDIIITTDPHCFFHKNFIRHILHRYEQDPLSVQVPRTHLLYGRSRECVIKGSVLSISGRGLRCVKARRNRRYPSLLGSVYVFPRTVMEQLGGWPYMPSYIGCTEQFLSVLLHRLGIGVILNHKAIAIHRSYRGKGRYPFYLPTNTVEHVSFYWHLVCFPETFDILWKPILDNCAWGCERDIDWREIFADWPDYSRLKSLLSTKGVMSEHDFLRDVISCQQERKYELLRQTTLTYLESVQT